jgi:hypothetical protein
MELLSRCQVSRIVRVMSKLSGVNGCQSVRVSGVRVSKVSGVYSVLVASTGV